MTVGRPERDTYALSKDYIERAARLFPFEHHWVKDGGGKVEEGTRLLAQIKGELVLLSRKGKPVSSPGLARLLAEHINISRDITFVIGGADGVSNDLEDRAFRVVSMSSLTFQHDIAMLLFCEQVYRAYTILKNIPYHR